MANVGHHPMTEAEYAEKQRRLNTVEGACERTRGKINAIIGLSQDSPENLNTLAIDVRYALSKLGLRIVAGVTGDSYDDHYGVERATWLVLEVPDADTLDRLRDELRFVSARNNSADIALTFGAHDKITPGGVVHA